VCAGCFVGISRKEVEVNSSKLESAKRCKKAAVVANRRRPSIPANSMRKAGFLLHLESFVLADKFELGFMESLEA
jgi:hypothetical protein